MPRLQASAGRVIFAGRRTNTGSPPAIPAYQSNPACPCQNEFLRAYPVKWRLGVGGWGVSHCDSRAWNRPCRCASLWYSRREVTITRGHYAAHTRPKRSRRTGAKKTFNLKGPSKFF